MRHNRWDTDEPEAKATGTDRGSVRFLILAALTMINIGCLLGPRSGLVTGTGSFLIAGTLLWIATWLFTFFLDGWYGKGTNGTSGKIGVAFAWIVSRVFVGVVLAALGVSLTLTYGAALFVGIFAFFILDVIFLVVGN